MNNEKKILWVSRHAPKREQIEELQNIFGEVDIVQVSTTVKDGNEVKGLMTQYNASEVITVLPLHIIGQLTAVGVKPIRAVMDREVNKDGVVTFIHSHFERVENVKIESKPLEVG